MDWNAGDRDYTDGNSGLTLEGASGISIPLESGTLGHGGKLALVDGVLRLEDEENLDWYLVFFPFVSSFQKQVRLQFDYELLGEGGSAFYINSVGGRDLLTIDREGNHQIHCETTLFQGKKILPVDNVHVERLDANEDGHSCWRVTFMYFSEDSFIRVGLHQGSGYYCGNTATVLCIYSLTYWKADSAFLGLDSIQTLAKALFHEKDISLQCNEILDYFHRLPSDSKQLLSITVPPSDDYVQYIENIGYNIIDIESPDVCQSTFDYCALSLDLIRFNCDDGHMNALAEAYFETKYQDPLDDEARYHCDMVFANIRVMEWSYAKALSAHGAATAIDPVSGKFLLSVASYCQFVDYVPCITYRFEGVETFYLMVGEWRGERLALYFPRHRTIAICAQEDDVKDKIVRIVTNFESALLSHFDNAINYSAYQPKSRGILVGFISNLGHHVWQELSGIERIIAEGKLDQFESIIIGPHDYFDVLEIFPELMRLHQHRVGEVGSLFSTALQTTSQFFRPLGVRISKSLRDKILALSINKISAEARDRIENAQRTRLLYWINLRSHNKTWTDQVDGHVNIIKSIASRLNTTLGVIIDGMEDTADAAHDIIEKLPDEIEVFNTIGCSLAESIVWANSVHLYCSVIGSGLVINSWLADKPGVGHANNNHVNQSSFWSHVNETEHQPCFVRPTTEEDTAYGWYDCDWRYVSDVLFDIIERYHPQYVADRVT